MKPAPNRDRDLLRAISMIEAGLRLVKRSLSDPLAETDLLADWLAAQCDTSDPAARTKSAVLYDAFTQWMRANRPSCDQWTTTRFGRRLRDRGFLRRKNGDGCIQRLGIRLRAADESGIADEATDRSRDGSAEPTGEFSLPFEGLISALSEART